MTTTDQITDMDERVRKYRAALAALLEIKQAHQPTAPGRRAKLKTNQENYRRRNRQTLRDRSKARRENLVDDYVRQLLSYGTDVAPRDWPAELVAAQREVLRLKRSCQE